MGTTERIGCRGSPSRTYLSEVVLTDGGVYDNLGLETAWKKYTTVLVSNGGGKMHPDPNPKEDPVRHGLRVNEIIDNQVRSLRARQVIGVYQVPPQDLTHRKGTYWSIRSNISDYGLSDSLGCPFDQTNELAAVETRLQQLDSSTQERLINWGYAVCDAAMRRWVDSTLNAPVFPYPAAKVG